MTGGRPARGSRHPIAILGSGFAGTILARAIHARGRPVVLLERDRHPRFALGESSTPLAAIALERLAADYGLPDLRALAAHGAWTRSLPGVRRGLKRGFSFYLHRPGEPYRNDAHNSNRLLVAASPDDEIADSHWLREDVDHHLVRRARHEGVDVREGVEVVGLDRRRGGWRVRARTATGPEELEASFLVDGTGAAGIVARCLDRDGRIGAPGAASGGPGERTGDPRGWPGFATGLLYAHFEGVRPLQACAPNAHFGDAPYPESRAAVHHLLEEGWAYVLPFDDGRVSAGLVLDGTHPETGRLLGGRPDASWRTVLGRYPSLERAFERARPLRPIRVVPRLQRRAPTAAGPGFALLPHTFAFASPMFSTGIAWSLIAVERLARILGGPGEPPKGGEEGAPDPDRLRGYAELLTREADHLGRILAPAYRLRSDMEAFTAWSFVYFALASFAEARQRLCDPPPAGAWSDDGFLGAGDPEADRALRRILETATSGPTGSLEPLAARALAARDVVGLDAPPRPRLYGVDLEALVARSARLGLSPEEARRRLPRLRAPALAGSP